MADNENVTPGAHLNTCEPGGGCSGCYPAEVAAKPDQLHTLSREGLEAHCRTQRDTLQHQKATLERMAAEADEARTRAEQLSQKVTAYEAGMDPAEHEEGAQHTPASLWRALLQADHERRALLLDALLSNINTANECFMLDHRRRIENMAYEREQTREVLSAAVFGEPTVDSFVELIAGVRALRQVMVDGIAARGQVLTTVHEVGIEDLPGFPGERDVREKIGEQLKTAGIDTQSLCRYEWTTSADDDDGCNEHVCGEVNPLHAQAHSCEQCGVMLSHQDAERIEMAK